MIRFIPSYMLYLSCILFLMNFSAYAQQRYVEKSDPEAKKILKEVKSVIKEYDALKIEYELTLENGEEEEIQVGTIIQKDNKYCVTNNGNVIINDNQTVWLYMKNQNEVQINDFEEEDELSFSPNKIFNLDESEDEFFYAITDQKGNLCKIEFKPLEKGSEIMKIRVEIDKAQRMIKSVKVFQTDGIKLNFKLNKVSNYTINANTFSFIKSKYPGVKEVDLRD